MKTVLRLMADYSATGLWDMSAGGACVELEKFNISKSTKELIKIWMTWFETSDSYLTTNADGFTLCTLEEFQEIEGLIYKRLVRELPDYEIVRDIAPDIVEDVSIYMVD